MCDDAAMSEAVARALQVVVEKMVGD